MKIASASFEMQASYFAVETREVNERFRLWNGERRGPDGDRRTAALPQLPPAAEVSLSAPGRLKSAEAQAIDAAQQSAAADPMVAFLKTMLFRMFGIDVDIFDPSEMTPTEAASAVSAPADPAAATAAATAAAPPTTPSAPAAGAAPAAGFGLEYDYHATRTETESLSFAAEGTVQTADGQSISFSISIAMTRTFAEQTDFSLRLGEAARKKDPLVVNFAGNAAQLSDRTFRIDLDDDGEQDNAHFLAPGSGFLVFDRNGNGRVDGARELFGPRSGDGFAELAALDSDGNDWIDENDADFAQLRLWTRDATDQDRLQTLADANVGALSLARLATPFSLKDAGSNALLGQVRSSGVYLSNDGKAGTVQQIDLAV